MNLANSINLMKNYSEKNKTQLNKKLVQNEVIKFLKEHTRKSTCIEPLEDDMIKIWFLCDKRTMEQINEYKEVLKAVEYLFKNISGSELDIDQAVDMCGDKNEAENLLEVATAIFID